MMRLADQAARTELSSKIYFLARYAVVGTISALVYVGVYYGLVVAAFAPSLPASCFAYSVSIIVQYTAHARISFNSQVIDFRQGARFAGATLIGLAASSAIAFAGPRVGWPPLLTAGVVVAILPPLNLVLLARWVFAARSAKSGVSSRAD